MEKNRIAYSPDELAAALGISRHKAYELVNRADFPAVRLGRRIVVPCDLLEKWLADNAGMKEA